MTLPMYGSSFPQGQGARFGLTSAAHAAVPANMAAGMKVKLPRTSAELGEASRQDASLSKASEEALTVLSWVQEGAARQRTNTFTSTRT